MKKRAVLRRRALAGLAGCFAAATILSGATGCAVSPTDYPARSPSQTQPQPSSWQCLPPLPSLQTQDPLMILAQDVLTKEGRRIADLIGRPDCAVDGITFVIDDVQGMDHRPAETSGSVITLFRRSLNENPGDIQGVIVHELTHAIQRAPVYSGGDFGWMAEGLADFVRAYLGYGLLGRGDPHESYKVAGGFFYWMYLRPGDNRQTFNAFVKDLNNGRRPANLDALLKEFDNGAGQIAAAKMKTVQLLLPRA